MIDLPEGADGVLWYVATHPRNRASLHEIETRWSFDDLMMAYDVYHALDAAEARAHANARRQARGI